MGAGHTGARDTGVQEEQEALEDDGSRGVEEDWDDVFDLDVPGVFSPSVIREAYQGPGDGVPADQTSERISVQTLEHVDLIPTPTDHYAYRAEFVSDDDPLVEMPWEDEVDAPRVEVFEQPGDEDDGGGFEPCSVSALMERMLSGEEANA